jgi:ferredoxin
MPDEAHTDLHVCTHDCQCFWCRVSRREKFEPTTEVLRIGQDSFDKAHGIDSEWLRGDDDGS